MVYGDLQFFDIIVFAAIAVFIIYRLRSVLGKRTGFQKNVSVTNSPPKATKNIKTEIPPLSLGFRFITLKYLCERKNHFITYWT